MDEQEDPGEIVVRGRALIEARKIYDQEANFASANWFYNRQYGPNTNNPDPFRVNKDDTLPPSEIVSRACESLALAIETLTNLARPVLPRGEARRLDALSATLKRVSVGVKAGQIDMATARSLVQSSVAVALDTMTGLGIGVLFAALGSLAATAAPTPLTAVLASGGVGVVGIAVAWYVSDRGAAEAVAERLTGALFDGAEAFARAFNAVMREVYDAFEGRFRDVPQEMGFDLRGTPMQEGGGVRVTLFREGVGHDLFSDSTGTVSIPSTWTRNGDPKSPWNDEAPI